MNSLSDITERLQMLAKSKQGNSVMTGSEFVDAYGTPGQPLDSECNRNIATAGGDIQNAYSKVYSVYERSKNANESGRNEFKVHGDAVANLNTEAIVGDLQYAIGHLESAAEKLEGHDISIRADIRELIQQLHLHRDRIQETGLVVVE